MRITTAGFLELGAGTWSNGSPLTVARDELPVMDREKAKAIVRDVEELPYAKIPAPPSRGVIRRVQPLPPMHKLTWNDTEAIERLQKNGYGVAPCPAGHIGLVTSSREVPVAVVHVSTKVPQVLGLLVDKYGAGPYRLASDGSRAYVFRADEPFQDLELGMIAKSASGGVIPGTLTRIRAGALSGVVALSGADEAGKPYRWDGSLLETKRDELPRICHGTTQMLLNDVQRLLDALGTDRAA